MDEHKRLRLKQLANDAIIACFGLATREAQLAEGLEQAISELDEMQGKCDTCKYCPTHGDFED